MKVIFVWRGPSPYRVDFFNELGKYCDLTVLFEMRPQDISDKEQSWFNERYVNFNAIYLRGRKLFGRVWFCPNVFDYIKAMKNADILVVGMYSTMTQALLLLYLKACKIKYILNSDGGFIKRESLLTRLLKRFFIGGASAYLSSGKGTNKYLRFYGAINTIGIYPFTSAFEYEIKQKSNLSNKTDLKKKLDISEDTVILFTGQFIHRKGIDILLKSCVGLPRNCGVYIVGGIPTAEYLELVDQLQLHNIHFISFKPPKELQNYYGAADIYVLPTREDIWGLVINEAMAYGLPVITTDNCLAGLELIEDDKNGYIVETGNTEQLSKCINRLVLNKELRMKIGKNNRLKMLDYTIEKMALSHIELFLKLQAKTSSIDE